MKHAADITADRRVRIAVRIATDAETENFALMNHTCELLRRVSCMMPCRKAYEGLTKAAAMANTVLLDADGNRAAPADLSDDDFYSFSLNRPGFVGGSNS